MDLRILFVGDSWKGSTARTLRGALDVQPSVLLEEVDCDHYLTGYNSFVMRAVNRLLRPLQRAELARAIRSKVRNTRPDVLLIFKGYGVQRQLLAEAKAAGILLVNVFPDCSPHAHGRALRHAMGEYDLVISSKPFHAANWRRIYGYSNRCVFVPKGYDPVHYWPEAPTSHDVDVVLAATWRREYHDLMKTFADQTQEAPLQVAIAGSGWLSRRREFPGEWRFLPALTGRSYGEFLRSGRIAIAPVQREMIIDGARQPGDEDTTRTYELAAAHCFFIHRRTEYVRTVYDELHEVPLWDDATELSALVRRFLPCHEERRAMAAAAHARIVSRYSASQWAAQVLGHLHSALWARNGVKA